MEIVVRAVVPELDPQSTPVSAVMTREVRTVDEALPIEQALHTMAAAGVRRVVVTGPNGRLCGLVSVDDVLELMVEEAESVGRLLRRSTGPGVAAD